MIRKTVLCRSYEGASPRLVIGKDVCGNFVVLKMMYRLSLWTSNLVLIFFWNYFRSSDDVRSVGVDVPVD